MIALRSHLWATGKRVSRSGLLSPFGLFPICKSNFISTCAQVVTYMIVMLQFRAALFVAQQ